MDHGLIDHIIPKLVTEEGNDSLTEIPIEVIKNTIFDMDPNSYPGLDGYSALFF